MNTSAFFTTAPLTTSHGGGNVSVHELEALMRVTDVKQALDINGILPEPFGHINMIGVGPFIIDYFAMLRYTTPVDLLMFNGACFAVTRTKYGCSKAISDVPAHDLKESIKEHVDYTGNYQYVEQVHPLLKMVMRHHIKTSEVVLVPSKYSEECLVRDEEIPREKITIIPHGCEPPESIPDLPQFLTFGTLGSNAPDKGHIYLLNAIPEVFKESKSSSAYFVGGGSDRMRNALIEFGDADAASRVRTSPHVENISDFFSQLSIYIQPSVTEGFGIPVLEAMSHGRPVVVTEGVGAKDLIEDGKEGFVVPIRNPHAIANTVLYFHDNPDEIRRMGQKARAKAEQYTWTWVEGEYEKLYKSVLE